MKPLIFRERSRKMREEGCIFCKLANGDIPTNKIYEDEDFTIILDASPASRGHALILPKDHAANLFELPESAAAKVLVLAKKAAAHMKEVLKCDGLHLVQNNGEAAGQTVFHFHMHLIPRYKEGPEMLLWPHQSFTDEEMKEIADTLTFS